MALLTKTARRCERVARSSQGALAYAKTPHFAQRAPGRNSMGIVSRTLLLLMCVTALGAPRAEAGRHRLACGTEDADAAKTADVEFAGIIPGRGLVEEDF